MNTEEPMNEPGRTSGALLTLTGERPGGEVDEGEDASALEMEECDGLGGEDGGASKLNSCGETGVDMAESKGADESPVAEPS